MSAEQHALICSLRLRLPLSCSQYGEAEEQIKYYYLQNQESTIPREVLADIMSEQFSTETLDSGQAIAGNQMDAKQLDDGSIMCAHTSGQAAEVPMLTIISLGQSASDFQVSEMLLDDTVSQAFLPPSRDLFSLQALCSYQQGLPDIMNILVIADCHPSLVSAGKTSHSAMHCSSPSFLCKLCTTDTQCKGSFNTEHIQHRSKESLIART